MVIKLDFIYVQIIVRFLNGFIKVFYLNKGLGFLFFGGYLFIMFVFVFFVVINLIRFVLIQIVIFVEFKVKLELVLVKLIIEKLEIFKLVEKVGKLGIFFLLQICFFFIGVF